MNYEEWQNNVLSVIKELGNIEYQREVWLHGKGEQVSSFDEAICKLFDDFFKYISDKDNNIEKYKMLEEYHLKLTNYLNNIEDNISIITLLNDPSWKELCLLANTVYIKFKSADR